MAASTVANVFIGTAILRVEYLFWGYLPSSITYPYNLQDYHDFMEYYIPKFLEMRKLSKEEDKEELLSDKVLSDRPIVIANTRKHLVLSDRRLEKYNPKYE